MVGSEEHPAVARLRRTHDPDLLGLLSAGITGADLTSLLLEAMRQRVGLRTAADVLHQYERDRFVRPAALDPLRLMEVEMRALAAVVPPFEPVQLAPLAPFGAHAVVAGVNQHRVVTTVRGSDVVADPTNVLALEAAVRRRSDPRSPRTERLAAVSRVVRAQQFDAPNAFPHFSLLGMVSAGRDIGDNAFEIEACVEHLTTLLGAIERVHGGSVTIRLTDFDGRDANVLQTVIERIGSAARAEEWPERTAARGYYPGICFKLFVTHDGVEVEVADGGMVDWTQHLVASKKERLMISGLGLERLAFAGD
ncbi:MAG: hypothetical protein FJW95_10545 [Actinobacteria bacterium]|nr:hypothetical protein [Actinomycetota bacterium]